MEKFNEFIGTVAAVGRSPVCASGETNSFFVKAFLIKWWWLSLRASRERRRLRAEKLKTRNCRLAGGEVGDEKFAPLGKSDQGDWLALLSDIKRQPSG
jgi:hypothetical protein